MMLIGSKSERAVKLEICLRRLFKHGPTATFLKVLVFRDGQGSDPDGYQYHLQTCGDCKAGRESGKTDCCWDKVGISRQNLRTARRNTRYWLVDEKHGWGNRVYYKPNLLALMDYLETMAPEFFENMTQKSQNNQTEWWNQPVSIQQ